MKLINLLLIASLLLAFTLAKAQTQPYSPIVVISDIDDTLKVSHILDVTASTVNLPHTENVFRGMPALFQILKQRVPQMPFFYLSNAPDVYPFTTLHQAFITQNNFPPGALILRRDLPLETHKIMKMREIINRTQPQYVLAFGDNGEKDIEVYDQIRQEYPAIKFYIYIHQIYATKTDKSDDKAGLELMDRQVGFVTPVEISMDLALRGLLSAQVVQSLMDLVIPAMIQTANYEDKTGRFGELSFPYWEDCRDYKWPARNDQVRWGRDGLYNALKMRIQIRCANPPTDKTNLRSTVGSAIRSTFRFN